MKFTENIEIPLEKCFNTQLGTELIKLSLEFITRLKYTEIDSTEFAILNAIVLTYPGELCCSCYYIETNCK